MTQKFYVDGNGDYLGSYDGPDLDNPFSGDIEIATPPANGKDNWNGSSWDAFVFTPDIEDIREECRRRIKLDGHDLASKMATPPAASTTYLDDCVLACQTLEGTLPSDYLTNSTWPTLPA